MTWLVFIFALEAGFQSQDVLLYEQPTFEELTAGYAIENPLRLEGGTKR